MREREVKSELCLSAVNLSAEILRICVSYEAKCEFELSLGEASAEIVRVQSV